MGDWYNKERVAQKGSVILTEFCRQQALARERKARDGLAETQKRAFAAAQLNRLTSSWQLTRERIDEELRSDLDALRSRSRTLEANNDFARRYFDLVETNVIGSVSPRLVSLVDNQPGKPDDGARKAIVESFTEWSRAGNCEVSGQHDFTTLCQAIARGTARDGEYLVMQHFGKAAGNRWGYALQVFDVDRIATWMSRNASEGLDAIRAGVQINEFGRPVGLWLNKTNAQGNRGAEFVSADTVLHRFVVVRPEQRRGIPWAHASMLSMHYAGEFALSALMAAKHGADHMGFFVSPDGAPPNVGDDDDPEKFMTSAPGTYDTLPVGYDIRTVDSKYPNEVFAPFIKSAHQRMASGLPGASYPELCNDYEAVNFSSIRAAILSGRDEWRKRQKWFGMAWLTPIFNNWLRFALANNAIVLGNGSPLPLAKIEKFSAHSWQFRGWSWVDPVKDMAAAKEALAMTLTSRSRLVAEMGGDLEEILDERQREEALASRYGISFSVDKVLPKSPINDAAP